MRVRPIALAAALAVAMMCPGAMAAAPAAPSAAAAEPAPSPPAKAAPGPAPAATAPAQPAPAATAEAEKPKAETVISPLLPDVSGVFDGKAVFSKEAFPILGDRKAVDLQGALGRTRPIICRSCHGTGKVSRRKSYSPPSAGFMTAQTFTKEWEDTCETCGGYGDIIEPKFGQQLMMLLDVFCHLKPDDAAAARARIEERLRPALGVRDKTWQNQECVPIVTLQTVPYGANPRTERIVTGLDLKPGPEKKFHLDVPAMIAPVWAAMRDRPPTGQAVVLVGTAADKGEIGGRTWVKLLVEGSAEAREGGTSAIGMFDAALAATLAEGRVVVGGLMVGRWYRMVDPSTLPVAPGATPVPPGSPMVMVGPPVPVILASVVAGPTPAGAVPTLPR